MLNKVSCIILRITCHHRYSTCAKIKIIQDVSASLLLYVTGSGITRHFTQKTNSRFVTVPGKRAHFAHFFLNQVIGTVAKSRLGATKCATYLVMKAKCCGIAAL